MSILSSATRPKSNNFQLSINEAGKVVTDLDSYSQSLALIILTEPGTDVMRADFGVGAHALIGQPMGSIRGRIKRDIERQCDSYLPEIKINSVKVVPISQGQGHLQITVDWSLLSSPENSTSTTVTA